MQQSEHKTPFSTYMVRTKIGEFEASLEKRQKLQAEVRKIVEELDAGETEHATVLALRPIISRANNEAGRVLEDALDAVAAHPEYQKW